MRRVAFVILAAVVLVVSGRLPAAGARQGQGTGNAAVHPLVGSWEVRVRFEGDRPIEVTNLITFTADGGILAASGGELPNIPGVFGTGLVLTEGHGAWLATGERTADGTFRSLTLGQTGGISSTNTARMSVTVDATGDAYTGDFSFESVSPSGNSMGMDRGTLSATRITVEPPALTAAATPVAMATPVP